MFEKLLIANRGEIACRVMKTARRLGIRTVAVYSDADADAMHVRTADEAVRIGPPQAAKSYLDKEAVLTAARETGAEAIHPGYGFLSENADFAEAVAASGLVFVGPPVQAIRDMGAKDTAKAIMRDADVPMVPGYFGDDQSFETLEAEARTIGFPVLVKAAMGGGGKGMRVAADAANLKDSIASARREAEAAFGDGRLLLEKFLTETRHVEVQVFADRHGGAVHLFERDCSLQRRHQKIIEEAPAPGLSDNLRERFGEAAVAAARAVGYEGAGTVEFLLDADGEFYFLEMNTRLQVEHPVTEMITGFDLVEWQLRVAAGEPLPADQSDIRATGHAFEARVYAEDPANGFLPAPGPLHHLAWPADVEGLRIDTGVAAGDEVSAFYDPMIAKVIVAGADREQALRRLERALRGVELVSAGNNLGFLTHLAGHPVFRSAEMTTSFVDTIDAADYAQPLEPPAGALAAAALFTLDRNEREVRARAESSEDPYSPWNATDCWRLNDRGHFDLNFRYGENLHAVSLTHESERYVARIDGEETVASEGNVVETAMGLTVFSESGALQLKLHDPVREAGGNEGPQGGLEAPMPGRVIAVNVGPGDNVSKGDVLVVLEAMKMEHSITAPRDGVIEEIRAVAGDSVVEGDELLALAE